MPGLPAFLRRFRSREDVERAIAEAIWLYAPEPGRVRVAFPVVAGPDGGYVVFLAHGTTYRAVTQGAGRILNEESAEVLVRARLEVAFRNRNATFVGHAAELPAG